MRSLHTLSAPRSHVHFAGKCILHTQVATLASRGPLQLLLVPLVGVGWDAWLNSAPSASGEPGEGGIGEGWMWRVSNWSPRGKSV